MYIEYSQRHTKLYTDLHHTDWWSLSSSQKNPNPHYCSPYKENSNSNCNHSSLGSRHVLWSAHLSQEVVAEILVDITYLDLAIGSIFKYPCVEIQIFKVTFNSLITSTPSLSLIRHPVAHIKALAIFYSLFSPSSSVANPYFTLETTILGCRLLLPFQLSLWR